MREEMYSCTSTMDSYHEGDMHDDLQDDPHDDIITSGGNNKPDGRKSNKPIMEKRRRARINSCLNELKGILLEAMRKDPARHSKLEKADILELSVRHLQNIQRNQLAVAMATDPTVLYRFKNGFSECASEVGRYLSKLDNIDDGMKSRVGAHLTTCVNGLHQVNSPGVVPYGTPARYPSSVESFVTPPIGLGLFSPPVGHSLIPASNLTPPGDMNNNKDSLIHRPVPIPAFNLGVTTTKPPTPSPSSSNESPLSNPLDYSVTSRGIRVVKMERLTSPTTTSSSTKDSMWRPW